jgi:prepilin-type N-terminal cleavage/methylation domain-containing protein
MRGFTLVELVMVIVVMTILAIAILPRAPSSDSLTLRSRAEQLATDIRYIQSMSMTGAQRFCVVFAPAAGPPYSGYSLARNGVGACDTAVAHPAGLAQPIDVCMGANCLTPVTNLPNDFVMFDGRGAPFSAAAAALAANADITLTGDGGPVVVRITPVTGRVSVP